MYFIAQERLGSFHILNRLRLFYCLNDTIYNIHYTFCGATTRIMHSDMSILFFSLYQKFKSGKQDAYYRDIYHRNAQMNRNI